MLIEWWMPFALYSLVTTVLLLVFGGEESWGAWGWPTSTPRAMVVQLLWFFNVIMWPIVLLARWL